MKRVLGWMALATVVFSCQTAGEDVQEFTGNETTYALLPGSSYNTSGSITFKEKKDGTTLALVNLDGLSGSSTHPVHLHLGDLSQADADIALLLSPVSAKTGSSETIVKQLADETAVRYPDILKLNASIKIHLAETGAERNIILAAGNIGRAAADKASSNGRLGIGVCKSE